MAERKPLSKKIRFEVFKRDKFTCQYCGRKAPDVVLNVDHINPVAKGGTNDLFNLITSCFECNNGKRDIPLCKLEELDKQRESLEMLEERRQQIDMMLKWKKELSNVNDYEVDKIAEYIKDEFDISVTENGRASLQKYIREFGFAEVLEAVNISFNQYDGGEKSFSYIPRICHTRKEQTEHPELKSINYLAKIAQNRCAYFDRARFLKFMRANFTEEDFDDLKYMIQTVRNWSELRHEIETYYEEEL